MRQACSRWLFCFYVTASMPVTRLAALSLIPPRAPSVHTASAAFVAPLLTLASLAHRNRVAIEKTPEKKTVEDRREPLNEGGGGPVSIVKQNKAKTTSEKEREKRVNMRRRLTGQRGGSAASSAAAVEASSTSVSVGVVGTVALGLGLAAGAILQSLKKQ